MAEEIKLEPCVKCGRERFYDAEYDWYLNHVKGYLGEFDEEEESDEAAEIREDIEADPAEFDMCPVCREYGDYRLCGRCHAILMDDEGLDTYYVLKRDGNEYIDTMEMCDKCLGEIGAESCYKCDVLTPKELAVEVDGRLYCEICAEELEEEQKKREGQPAND